jgi:hypothetical protein
MHDNTLDVSVQKNGYDTKSELCSLCGLLPSKSTSVEDHRGSKMLRKSIEIVARMELLKLLYRDGAKGPGIDAGGWIASTATSVCA